MRSKNPHYPTSAIRGRERCPSPIQFFRQLLVAAAVLFCPLAARAQGPGSVDTSFDPGSGANDIVRSVATQPDGKVLIGGYFTAVNGVTCNRTARLNANGSLDTGFNSGSGANNIVLSVVVQPDGKILIGGGFTQVNGVTRSRIARLYADGSLDPSFVPGTILAGPVPPGNPEDGAVFFNCDAT